MLAIDWLAAFIVSTLSLRATVWTAERHKWGVLLKIIIKGISKQPPFSHLAPLPWILCHDDLLETEWGKQVHDALRGLHGSYSSWLQIQYLSVACLVKCRSKLTLGSVKSLDVGRDEHYEAIAGSEHAERCH